MKVRQNFDWHSLEQRTKNEIRRISLALLLSNTVVPPQQPKITNSFFCSTYSVLHTEFKTFYEITVYLS